MVNEISFLIIVPTFNSTDILHRLVKSVREQTYRKWRLVFIDANSSKIHNNWLKKCISKDSRFLLKKETKQYKGIYPSMTLGTKLALKSDWLIFLGSDDWFNNKYSLEIIVNKIKSKKSTNGNVITLFNTQFLQDRTYKLLRFNRVPSIRKRINQKILYYLTFFGYMPPHQSACFSYFLIKKIMPYSRKYKLAADSDLFLNSFSIKNLKIIFIDELLINIQAGGISSKYLFKRVREVIRIYIDNFGFYFFIPLLCRYVRRFISRFRNI
tara:strand:- start:330 stop:1133 length:804 start_codon:yes stop_codon:yes gene_type:complete